MLPTQTAYFLALISAILFSGASVVFAQFSQNYSSLWMNIVKNSVALLAFVIASLLLWMVGAENYRTLERMSVFCFLASGFIGLAIGDYFLFQGFKRIGSARTLMVFSFSPLFLSIGAFTAFGQKLSAYQLLALFFLIACVWTISYERFRFDGKWEWLGILYAFLGVILDNIGVLLTRRGFDLSPGTNAFTANAFRCIGAVLLFSLLQRGGALKVWRDLQNLPIEKKKMVYGASFLGTFLSLSLWLTAVKIGHIASLAGVGAFNPIAASIWEWWLHKKRPTIYFCTSLLLFLIGFMLLLRHEG